MLGLIDAACRFDEARGIKFETFAERRVRGAMIDALRRDAWPRGVRRQRRELEAAREELRRELGAEPSLADLAARVGSDEVRLSRTIVRINTIESTSPLSAGDHVDGSTLPTALVPSEPIAPDRAYEELEVRDRVRAAIASLPPRERKVVGLYYYAEATMKQIGAEIGVNESRVSQLHARAIQRLRKALGADCSMEEAARALRPAILSFQQAVMGRRAVRRIGGGAPAMIDHAVALGADYVDVEWRGGFEELVRRTGGPRVILSSHEFEHVPGDLGERVRAMRGLGAEIVKIAIPARRLSDALPLLRVSPDANTVAIAMGASGIPSRVLAAHFGSRWTYAGDGVAPGQVPAARMIHELRFRDVSAATAVYGVVGTMTSESKSPSIHNERFAAAGIDAVMVPMQAPDFDDFLTFADALGVAGAAVTIPFKLDALQCAVRVADEARRVGAANTLRRGVTGGRRRIPTSPASWRRSPASICATRACRSSARAARRAPSS